ncbi:hypothetical protein [Nonomuraea indica]|uniref:hypothetical protein n=1 Tax=Nonomuraea indica TaxID=1581193 RepID=UPI000C7CA2E1|nr:hypothetical protein [Nonomuraea indica]
MHHPNDRRSWTEALIDRAARAAFPNWTRQDDDWTSLYTSFPDGNPTTEVAVYRGHDRIHYRRYTGDDLERFWTGLLEERPE